MYLKVVDAYTNRWWVCVLKGGGEGVYLKGGGGVYLKVGGWWT